MGPTPVQRRFGWFLCAGLIFFLWPAAAFAQTAGVRPDVERAAGKCALCHSPLLLSWQGLPHGGGSLGPDRKPTKPLKCTSCHPSGLLRGQPVKREDATQVCGKCHLKDEARSAIIHNTSAWKASRHAQSGTSCLDCHSLHRPTELRLLRQKGDGLCLGCHARDGQFEHKNSTLGPLGRANCTSCHDPHGSPEGGLYASRLGGEAWQLKKRYTHKPVAEGKCKDCHNVHQTPAGTGRTGVVEDEEDGVSPGDGGAGFGANRSLLVKPPVTVCYLCHGDKQAVFQASKHAEAGRRAAPPTDNACAACHLPHGSDFPRLTWYEGSRLCLTCHTDKTPHHFLVGAEVRQSKIECVECHNPHGSEHQAFLVSERERICAKCHKK